MRCRDDGSLTCWMRSARGRRDKPSHPRRVERRAGLARRRAGGVGSVREHSGGVAAVMRRKGCGFPPAALWVRWRYLCVLAPLREKGLGAEGTKASGTEWADVE